MLLRVLGNGEWGSILEHQGEQQMYSNETLPLLLLLLLLPLPLMLDARCGLALTPWSFTQEAAVLSRSNPFNYKHNYINFIMAPSRIGTSHDQSRIPRPLAPPIRTGGRRLTLYTRRLPSRSYLSSRNAGAMSSNVVTPHVSSGMWNSRRTCSTYCGSRSTSHRGSSRGFDSTFFRCTFPILPTPEIKRTVLV